MIAIYTVDEPESKPICLPCPQAYCKHAAFIRTRQIIGFLLSPCGFSVEIVRFLVINATENSFI